MSVHEFSQHIYGKSADEIEDRALAAVTAYFGSLRGVVWYVDTDAQVNLAGNVLGYVGRVRAERGASAPTLGQQLDEIGARLDAASAAWVAAGYPDEGPTVDAREAVFADLRAWNQRAGV